MRILRFLVPSLPKTFIKGPRGVQLSYQKLVLHPSWTSAVRNLETRSLRLSKQRQFQDSSGESVCVQKVYEEGQLCVRCQATHKELLFEKSSQTKRNCRVRQTVSQETFALARPSVAPDQRKREHRDYIFLMHPFGKRKVEIQNFTVPETTVFIKRQRPAKDSDFVAQKLNLRFSLSRRGEYSEIFSFLCINGIGWCMGVNNSRGNYARKRKRRKA